MAAALEAAKGAAAMAERMVEVKMGAAKEAVAAAAVRVVEEKAAAKEEAVTVADSGEAATEVADKAEVTAAARPECDAPASAIVRHAKSSATPQSFWSPTSRARAGATQTCISAGWPSLCFRQRIRCRCIAPACSGCSTK